MAAVVKIVLIKTCSLLITKCTEMYNIAQQLNDLVESSWHLNGFTSINPQLKNIFLSTDIKFHLTIGRPKT